MVMSPIHQVWPKQSCKAQRQGEEDKADRKEVKRQHRGMDRPGVHQVQGGSGEQRKMGENGCEVIIIMCCRNDPRGYGICEGVCVMC